MDSGVILDLLLSQCMIAKDDLVQEQASWMNPLLDDSASWQLLEGPSGALSQPQSSR